LQFLAKQAILQPFWGEQRPSCDIRRRGAAIFLPRNTQRISKIAASQNPAHFSAMLRYLLPLLMLTLPVLADAGKWEKEIIAFEKAPLRNGAIIFTGSSSIRLWKTLEKDFEGLPVVNRGFGGSQMQDSAELAERIVLPHSPRMVLIFAGTNDINAGKSPESVLQSFETWVAKLKEKSPATALCFLEITTSPSRWEQSEKVVIANKLIRAACEKHGVKFIPLREKLFGPDGKPREELFVADRLHLNADGYKILADAVRPFLPAK
jgi:lysophospholipase L1-like esterase